MLILSLLRKHQGRSPMSTGSTGRKAARYWCVECGRPRSSSYHSAHPPREPAPRQGVCRRCIRKDYRKELPPAVTIYEFHHYHHACACQQEQACTRRPIEPPLCSAYLERVELPAEEEQYKTVSAQLFEEVPPQVRFETKPRYRSD